MTPTFKRLVLVGGGAAIFCLALMMIVLGLRGNRLFFYDPSMVVQGNVLTDRSFRMGGLVALGSWVRDENGLSHKFDITDCHTRVSVAYQGLLPDLFIEGQGAVVRGRYDPQTQTMVADQVLARHDESYTPREVEAVLRDRTARPGEYQRLLEQGCEGQSTQTSQKSTLAPTLTLMPKVGS